MALLAPRWAALDDFGVMLRHVGGKMATKSARMSNIGAKERILEDLRVRLGSRTGTPPWLSVLAALLA